MLRSAAVLVFQKRNLTRFMIMPIVLYITMLNKWPWSLQIG